MTKNTKKTTEESQAMEPGGGVAVADRPSVTEPFGWMGDLFDSWPTMFGRRIPELFERGPGTLEGMRVEEFMDDDEAVVRVEIPGVDPEKDIDINVASGRLVVSAKREQRETKSEDGRRSEFHYGSFRRTMTLPPGVDADDVHATYTDGILEIRVPVDGEAQAKTKVPITRSAKADA